jgi:hypothetical protein
MSDIDIDIVIRCKCGKVMKETGRATEHIYGDRLAITVEPCQNCMDEERSEGYAECESDYGID